MNKYNIIFKTSSGGIVCDIMQNNEKIGTFRITKAFNMEAKVLLKEVQWKLSTPFWNLSKKIIAHDNLGNIIAESKKTGSWWNNIYEIKLTLKKYYLTTNSTETQYSLIDELNQKVFTLYFGRYPEAEIYDSNTNETDTILLISIVYYYVLISNVNSLF